MSIIDHEKTLESISVLDQYYNHSETVDLYRDGDKFKLVDNSGCCSWLSRIFTRLCGYRKVNQGDFLTVAAAHVNRCVTDEFVRFANTEEQLSPIHLFAQNLQREIGGINRSESGLPLKDVLTRIFTALFPGRQGVSDPVPTRAAANPGHQMPAVAGMSAFEAPIASMSPAQTPSVPAFNPWVHFMTNWAHKIPRYFSAEETNKLWADLDPTRGKQIQAHFTAEQTNAACIAAIRVADRAVKIRINSAEWVILERRLKGTGMPISAIERIKQNANYEINPGDFERDVNRLARDEIIAADEKKHRLNQKLFNTYNEIAKRMAMPQLSNPEMIPQEWFYDSQLDRNFPSHLTHLILENLKKKHHLQETTDVLMERVYSDELRNMMFDASGEIFQGSRPAKYTEIAVFIDKHTFGRLHGRIENYFTA